MKMMIDDRFIKRFRFSFCFSFFFFSVPKCLVLVRSFVILVRKHIIPGGDFFFIGSQLNEVFTKKFSLWRLGGWREALAMCASMFSLLLHYICMGMCACVFAPQRYVLWLCVWDMYIYI